MSNDIVVLVKRAAERTIISDILEEWHRRDPRAAKEAIRFIREVTAQDIHSSGKYKDMGSEDSADGHVKLRFPATLFWAIRRIFPKWGDDDADIRTLVTDFPDLMPRAMRKRIGAE